MDASFDVIVHNMFLLFAEIKPSLEYPCSFLYLLLANANSLKEKYPANCEYLPHEDGIELTAGETESLLPMSSI